MGNLINNKIKMKFIAAAILGAVAAIPAGQDKLHFFDFDNAKMLYKGDWAAYKASRPHDNDCSLTESDNWKGAQQCVESWDAEAPECAEEADGALDSTDARDLHSQPKLQAFHTPTEHAGVNPLPLYLSKIT